MSLDAAVIALQTEFDEKHYYTEKFTCLEESALAENAYG